MSSTNRSRARDKHVADYYKTPVEQIELFLREFLRHEPSALDGAILDPCAGGCPQTTMSYPEALEGIGIEPSVVDTIDIRQDSRARVKDDYLLQDTAGRFDAIITNPPFRLALKVIEKALQDVKDGGWVVMLLRLNFLEGRLRKAFWDKQMPRYIFVHHQRMSFTADGRTDSVAYAHYCWQKGVKPEFAEIRVI